MKPAGYPRELKPVLSADAIEHLFNMHKQKLLLFFEYHNYVASQLEGKHISRERVKRYQTTLSFLGCYVYRKYKREDVSIQHVNHEFVSGFTAFLKAELLANSVVDYCEECLMKILSIALAGGLTRFKFLPN